MKKVLALLVVLSCGALYGSCGCSIKPKQQPEQVKKCPCNKPKPQPEQVKTDTPVQAPKQEEAANVPKK